MKKDINRHSVRWVCKTCRHAFVPIIILTLCAVAVSYISVRFALVSKQLLDSAINSAGRSALKKNIINIVLLVAAQLAVQIIYTIINLHTETKLKNDIQRNLFSSLLKKDWSSLGKFHTGELLNRLGSDVNIVTNSVMTLMPNLFSLLSGMLMAFAALYSLDSQFALIFLIVGPIVMIVARLYSKKIKPLHKKSQACQGKTQSFMLEAIRNILVIKSFGVYDRITSMAHKLQKDNLKVIMKRGYLSIIANILFYISLTIGYYFAVVWCAYKISVGIMTVGTFTAIAQLVGQVQTPFKDIASMVPQFFAMTASAERIKELEDLEDEKLGIDRADINDIYEKMKSIDVKNIDFSYGDEKIFDCASICIDKNTTVAISGLSGIGKSTLLKLILGIISPSSGSITINCSDKIICADASVRKLFAYVPQGNMILSGTVRENISFMNPDICDEDIIAAAKTACIWDIICDMPRGLDTLLGEGGSGLSEGQIQRLSVARAVCSGAPVLLLDEATSALDEETEKNMLMNIRALKNRTCIIVSHKKGAFDISDKVISIKNKKIVEEL